MNRYNVLVEMTIEDAVYPVGSVVELEAEVAAPSVEAGELELVVDEAPTAVEKIYSLLSTKKRTSYGAFFCALQKNVKFYYFIHPRATAILRIPPQTTHRAATAEVR